MKPRQLVIVHGPPEASLDLAESCKAFSKDIKVYTPKLQETVDATSETHIYQVSLSKAGIIYLVMLNFTVKKICHRQIILDLSVFLLSWCRCG